MNELANRVALITGGASGIGKATIKKFIGYGAAVLCLDIDRESGEKLIDELHPMDRERMKFIHGSVLDPTAITKALDACVSAFGKVDTLVNNAGIFVMRGIEGTREEWLRSLEGNVIAYAMTAKEVAPKMMDAGGGSIVNVCSISAHVAQDKFWTYSSAKGAVHTLTKCMALDFAPAIRVNSVSPGTIWTESNRDFMEREFGLSRSAADAASHVGGKHILQRCGDPSEVAEAISFLASNRASFITGADLLVDGGYTAI